MEEREKFTFRKEWYDVIQELPVQVRSEVCVAIIEYGITGKLPLLKAQAKLAVHFIKKELDKDYEEELHKAHIREVRSEAGKRGAEVTNNKKKEDFADGKNAANQNFAGGKSSAKPRQKSGKIRQNSLSTSSRTRIEGNQDNIKNINPKDSVEEEKEKVEREKDENLATVPPPATPQRSTKSTGQIEARKEAFYNSLIPYVQKYGKEMIRSFFDYWSEANRSKTKMRFELEKTWETSRRLVTWASRDKNFKLRNNYGADRTDNQEKKAAEDALEVMQRIKSRAGIAEQV